ncbi:MAG: hypothetical protein AB1505_21285 [Candidatus Latescibacterota bacterium]
MSGEADPILLDERLFTAFAMLNALGYNDEYREEGMHPVRLAVRARMAGLPEASLAQARNYQAHHPPN